MKFTLLSILLNHSTFLLASLTNETAIQPTQATSQSLVQVEQECIICLKEMQSVELYPSFECFHENIHKACVHKYMNTAHTYARCPLCRAKPLALK